MNLYNVFPSLSQFEWNRHQSDPNYVEGGAKVAVTMKGIWLGTKGREHGFLWNFVPVVVHEEEPQDEHWGVIASLRDKPKIAANKDGSPGFIALISSYRGDGPGIGQVLVSHSSIPNVFVIAHGIGGKVSPLVRYWDYLVKISGPAEFIVEPTVPHRYLLRFTPGEEVREYPVTVDVMANESFVLLNDPAVTHWRSNGANGK